MGRRTSIISKMKKNPVLTFAVVLLIISVIVVPIIVTYDDDDTTISDDKLQSYEVIQNNTGCTQQVPDKRVLAQFESFNGINNGTGLKISHGIDSLFDILEMRGNSMVVTSPDDSQITNMIDLFSKNYPNEILIMSNNDNSIPGSVLIGVIGKADSLSFDNIISTGSSVRSWTGHNVGQKSVSCFDD